MDGDSGDRFGAVFVVRVKQVSRTKIGDAAGCSLAGAALGDAAVGGAAMGAGGVEMVGIATLVWLVRLVGLVGLVGLEMRLGIVAVLNVTRRAGLVALARLVGLRGVQLRSCNSDNAKCRRTTMRVQLQKVQIRGRS